MEGTPKQLFSVVNSITNNRQISPLPDHKSHEEIADDFANFFIGKIQEIREELSSAEGLKPQVNNIPQLKKFSPLEMEEVQKEIKEILISCIETITHIVNTSLTKGMFANNSEDSNSAPPS